MTTIPYLPFEIIESIDSYLSLEDRFELVRLNHTFYQVFIILLYRTITIETRQQFDQLIHLFQETVNSQLPLGQCVHQLSILLDALSEHDLQKVQTLCPYLQSVHIDWRIWNYLAFLQEQPNTKLSRNYHSRRTLPPFAIQFIAGYGTRKLSSLTLDLYSMSQLDGRSLLSYTPYIRNLTLMGISQDNNIDIQYVEAIHEQCPFLEQLVLEGYKAEAQDFFHMVQPPHIQPSPRMKSFQLKLRYGADRYQDWLPYLGKKYPNLTSLDFEHLGSGKDIVEPCSGELYRQFIASCPNLTFIRWNNTAPDFRFFQELDRAHYRKLKRLEVFDNLSVPELLTTALFDSRNQILGNLTHLTFGPTPRGVAPTALVQSIALACPRLTHLCLREPHCNLNTPFKVDAILNHCRNLVSLELHKIALRVSFDCRQQDALWDSHPLRQLKMHHCSSFDGVLDHISVRCPDLNELYLYAYTQRDRRYKVHINMPYQRFRKIHLHGMRTETFDMERRIRFFSLRQMQQSKWLYMKQFVLKDQEVAGRGFNYRGMEMAQTLVPLKNAEVFLLKSFLEKPMSWSALETSKQEYLKWTNSSIVEDWHPKDIYDAGYVDLVCRSVELLSINRKLVL